MNELDFNLGRYWYRAACQNAYIRTFSLETNNSGNASGLMQLMSSGTWYISSGSAASEKDRLATIKKDMGNNTHSANVFLQGNSSQHFAQPLPDYSARGDFHNRSFFIYRGTIPVAEVQDCMPNVHTLLHAYPCPCSCVVSWHATGLA